MKNLNFHYEHRCLIVTNEDYESNYMPELADFDDTHSKRSYTATELEISKDFVFWNIDHVDGYYKDGCITAFKNDHAVSAAIAELSRCNSLTELSKYAKAMYGITFYRIRKLRRQIQLEAKVDDAPADKDRDCAVFVEKLINFLLNDELKKIDAIMDDLKVQLGFEEIELVSIREDGEGIYKAIPTSAPSSNSSKTGSPQNSDSGD